MRGQDPGEEVPEPTFRGGPVEMVVQTMVLWDMRIQARYGLYAVYAILTIIFVLGLRAVGPALETELAILLIVTDPTVLGFYFIGAMVLFEKSEGVLDALVESPLGVSGYLASKVLSLTLLATAAATAVAVLGHGILLRIPVLVGGVAISASLFVLVGFVAVARFDSINAYFLSAVVWGTVIFLPIFGFLGLVETPIFYILPAQPVFVLVEAGFRPVAGWKLLYAIGYVLVGNAIAFVWARRTFEKHVVRGGDPGRKLGHVERTRRDGWSEERRLPDRFPWAGLALADLKNWVRDPLLGIAAAGPVLLALVIRYGAPIVAALSAPMVDLQAYYPVIAGAMVVFGPGIYGFVVGMFVLEDREQDVLAAFRVSPLTTRGYLLYRCATAYAFGFVVTLPALFVVGLVPIPIPVIVGSTAVGALTGPLIALGLGLAASNTIEGIALSKFANLAIIGPAFVVALVPEPFQFVGGVFPTFWPVKAFVAGASRDPAWVWYLLLGIVVYALAFVALSRRVSRRIG